MSEMDDITREAGRFTAQIAQLLARLSHTKGWREKRQIKKGINLLVREQTRTAEQLRTLELGATAGAIDNYRQHCAAVNARAIDPVTSAEQRVRDRESLTRHHGDLEARVLESEMLTPIEQGMALDGMAAATRFPDFKLGNLFKHARKVRGLDALRYRAQVARAHAATGIARTPAYSRPAITQSHNGNGQAHPDRQLGSGYSMAQADAAQMIRRSQAVDRPWAPHPQQRDAAAQQAARAAAQAGLSAEQITWEFNNATANSRAEVAIVARYPSLNGDLEKVDNHVGLHPNEREAAAWAAMRQGQIAQFGTPKAVRLSGTESGHSEPFFTTEGSHAFVTDEVNAWRAETTRAVHDQPPETTGQDRSREKSSSSGGSEDLERRVLMLQRGLDAVTADRDTHKQQLESVRAELDTLKNTQLRANRELREAREQLETVGAERDRFRGERDEAVERLKQQTPERDRYGSPERQAEQAKAVAHGRALAEDTQIQDATDQMRRSQGGDFDQTYRHGRGNGFGPEKPRPPIQRER
ncbi:hypothetical protein [Nocardia sp. NPDC059228]|uniref:hypothetical protein n=1 Tax=Nocardia sp. NPDC059228 TaxID=3346777 RepID=UPI0036897C1F